MDFATYQKGGRDLYEQLAEVVTQILAAALERQPSINVQHIQRRAKSPDSLREKLANRNALDSDTIELAVKDLAGCRIVLHTNSDVEAVRRSGIFRDNFDVDGDRTKIHHPVPGTPTADDLFISDNVVVKLKEDRTRLPEYARFAGLWCEVQVQTILNHAWSDMAHGTIYKRLTLQGFGTTAMKAIKVRLDGVMRKYLLPAGHEFAKVRADFERLAAGKALFDQGILRALEACGDNNARFEILERFRDHVFPYYDDLATDAPEIRKTLKLVAQHALGCETKQRDATFGMLPGYTADHVVDRVAGILDKLRYLDVETAFDDIRELFLSASSEKMQNRWIKSARELASYNVEMWNLVGPIVQARLMWRVGKLQDDELVEARPLILTILECVLDTEVEGASMTQYNAVTIQRGAAVPSDRLAEIRNNALVVLERLMKLAQTDAERARVAHTMLMGSEWPRIGQLDPKLVAMVLRNSITVVKALGAWAPQFNFELLQHLEEKLWWLRWHFHRFPEAIKRDADVDPLLRELDTEILRFRDQINADGDFTTFNVLVGHESIFPPAWDDPDFDHVKQQQYREAAIERLVKSVTTETAARWRKLLTRCVNTTLHDRGGFRRFLEQLGQSKPDIALDYVRTADATFEEALPSLIKGLESSDRAVDARAFIEGWVRGRSHYQTVIAYTFDTAEPRADWLEAAMRVAMDNNDAFSVAQAFGAAVARHNPTSGLITPVILPAMEWLAARRNFSWVQELCWRPSASTLFKDITDSQADRILQAIIPQERIDHDEQTVLVSLTKRWPEKVAQFFEQRLATEASCEDSGYDAIPSVAVELQAAWTPHIDLLVATARRWYIADKSRYSWRRRLIPAIFPRITQPLSAALGREIDKGDDESIAFVIATLRSYHDELSSESLCRRIVAALPEGHRLLDTVELLLEATGGVHGEFGLVAAYQNKHAAITAWLADDSPAVRAFATKYLHTLEQRIADAQRQAEEDLESRRLDFDWSSNVASE